MCKPSSFVSDRSLREWKQVAEFQCKTYSREMAHKYQPTRLPYGISRLLARSTTTPLARLVILTRIRLGGTVTYREAEKILKRHKRG